MKKKSIDLKLDDDFSLSPLIYSRGPFGSIDERGGREFNEEEGKENLLIIYMLGLKREGKKFNCKYVWFIDGEGGMIKLNYFFILIILQVS
jgi:hypothetical protein